MGSFSESLKKNFNVPAVEYDEQYQELKSQFLEMAQLKSNLDMEKLTVMSQGSFIAHQFHFLMRQYSLALGEVRRFALDREEKLRDIEKLENNEVPEGQYQDIEIQRRLNEIDTIELTLANKLAMCNHFEKLRQHLIQVNGGEITNEQYQAEEPEFLAWLLKCKAIEQVKQRQTGVEAGVWMNIQYLEEPAPLTPEYQVKILDDETGRLDFDKAQHEIYERMGLLTRVQKQLETLEERGTAQKRELQMLRARGDGR